MYTTIPDVLLSKLFYLISNYYNVSNPLVGFKSLDVQHKLKHRQMAVLEFVAHPEGL